MRAPILVLLLGLASTASAASADRNVYLAQAKVFYQGLEFEKCLTRLEQAARVTDSSREVLAQVELYNGLCKVNLSKRDDALAHFRLAVNLNPDIELPAGTSPRIAQMFDPLAADARASRAQAAKLAAAKDAPREVTLTPEPKKEPVPVVREETSSSGPRILPLALGGTAVGFVAAGIVFGSSARGYEAEANSPATMYSDAVTLGESARRDAMLANVAFGIAGTLAIGAVVSWIASE